MKERSGMPYDVVAYEADDLAMQLNEAEEGLFHRMLRRSWMNGSIPSEFNALASICRTHPARLKKAWNRIEPLWKPHPSLPGRLINTKQENERAWVGAKAESARKSAVSRWGSQGEQNQSSDSLEKSAPRDLFTHANHAATVNSHKPLRNKKKADANALPTQSERNASPSPSPSPSLDPVPIHISNTESIPIPPHSPVSTGQKAAEEMLSIYNANRGVLPEVRSLTKERVRKCKARTVHTNGNFLSDFTLAIQRARVLPFCCGEGAQGWRVDFDWLIANDTNHQKILEGKYDHVRSEQRAKSKGDITRKSCESILALSDSKTGGGG